MNLDRPRAQSPFLIMALGAVLFLIAVVHHASELYALNGLTGPLVALLVDGLPALGLIYAGYWFAATDLVPENRWYVVRWCLLGGFLFMGIMGLSLLVRVFEGRVVGEALFPLLIATEAGAIAGVIAGYSTARARREARRAETVSDALGVVNSLIRHDLRNDLNVIHGHADLIATNTEATAAETDPDSAAIIGEKADEALTRLETTEAVAETLIGEPELERVDLVPITTDLTTHVESTHDLSVRTDLPDHAHVWANAGLRSVVDNLLENAVEHHDAEEPRVRVEIETTAEAVRLGIADNGPGMSAEQQARVFAPHSEETPSGGLSLVQTLVEGYDGEVWIEANEPRGTVVTVELPRATPDRP